jgi:sucrose phosphorylase
MDGYDRVRKLLKRLYGPEGDHAYSRIYPLMAAFPGATPKKADYFSEKDTVLITYGDSLKHPGQNPIKTVHYFARKYLKDIFSTIHFLPFFPYSSDDGFSVIDFYTIDPELGTWEDVQHIRNDFDLMFDLVLNHLSTRNPWFDKFLRAEKGFSRLAIEVDQDSDLGAVVRPRALPLLTEFVKADGRRINVWTTFSADQVDLNYKSIDVLELMIGVLLFYVRQGAVILRLDAIAYLWKEIGTPCIHLPQTHDMVKLFRAILDAVAPDVVLITETNVPHRENISYFGDGADEAQMVYNFTLPPLVLHTLTQADATALTRWAETLALPSESNTFFNFTASHDGIGVRPLEGILPPQALADLIEVVKSNGGRVSYKYNPDGSESPYEMNITYVDALSAPGKREDPLQVERFMASQAIQYSLPGVPATYIHSLLGSHNWEQGVQHTGRARTINRKKLWVAEVERELQDRASFRARVFSAYLHMVRTRIQQPAFHPKAGFKILKIHPRVFAIARYGAGQTLYALTNVGSREMVVSLAGVPVSAVLKDVVTGQHVNPEAIRLTPYQFVWLSDTAG